jgi:DNA replication protein DnaC
MPTLADYSKFIVEPTEPVDDPTPSRVRVRFPSCMPRAYQNSALALKSRIHAKVWAALEKMDPASRYGMLILGPSGCGKSTSAAYVVMRWLTSKPVLKGPSWHDFETPEIDWLDGLVVTDSERRYKLGSGEPHAITDACRAEWLVLDDIGTSTSATIVQLILARRYAASLPTIVTSGLERGQLAEHLGAATVRRIVEFEGRSKGVLIDCHEPKPVKP